MKNNGSPFILFLLLFLLCSCSTGRKALERGDYEKAFIQALDRLKANGSSEKASKTLEKAYRFSLESNQNSIERARASNDLLKWETIAANYQRINFLYDEILRCPACREVIPNPVKYDLELSESKMKAADVRYRLGMEALRSKEDREKAIEAHQHFTRIRTFVPRYKDVDDKVAEALAFATLKVIVNPIPSPVRMYDLRHEFFVNKINEYLHNWSLNPYVRFYTEGEAESRNIGNVDHRIEMEFDRFSIGNVSSNKASREVSRDSVVISSDGKDPIYGTVKATVTVNEIAIISGGALDFKVFDPNINKVLTHDIFPGEYVWSAQWASYNGDERALSQEDLLLVNQREVAPPNPQWIFEEFTAPIYDQVLSKIDRFYKNY